jgi:hypothetical protein
MVTTLYGIFKYYLHRKLVSSTEVHYLIPQKQYPEKEFIGAPNKEITTDNLTIGIGKYRIIVVVKTKIDCLYDPISLHFEGDSVNKPKMQKPDNPQFIIRTTAIEGVYDKDWWGEYYPVQENWPRNAQSGKAILSGIRIESAGTWQGKLQVRVKIRNESVIKRELNFKVSIDEDEIPFLKGWGNFL